VNSDNTINQTSVDKTKKEQLDQKKTIYESDFGVNKNSIGEPVLPSLIKKCESIFGKGITVKNIHSGLGDEEKSKVLLKAGLPNLTQEDLYELDAQEFHLIYIHKGDKELGIVRWLTIDEKSVFVIYSSKNKKAYIKEIHSDDISQDFLKQFFGKGISNEIKIGKDIKVKDVNAVIAEKLTNSIRITLWVLQLRYNSDSKQDE
jgi:hypothetical protein